MKGITIAILLLLMIAGCKTSQNQPIGGQTDSHGCLIGAGYSYCPSTGQCQRMWETYCAEYADAYRGNESSGQCGVNETCAQNASQIVGGQTDSHGCVLDGGYQWCPSTGKCQRMWETYCAEYADSYRGNETSSVCSVDKPCTANNLTLNNETCTAARGHWNECGSKCAIDNQGKTGIVCAQVCDAICECGGIAGFGCPNGFSCNIPQGIVDAMGYCR